jgi:hypothetical protein
MANTDLGRNSNLDIDWRARLQVMRANKDSFFPDSLVKTDILSPLKPDRGIMFHYQPSIFIAFSATYDTQQFQGTNYPLHTYMMSSPPTIPLQVQYSVTTQEEARYLLAIMHFLKVTTKANFGEAAVSSNKFGAPPPVLEFSYLGPHGYDRVPVVINDVNFIMENNVDYIPVQHNIIKTNGKFVSAFKTQTTTDGTTENNAGEAAGVTYVPTDLQMTITLMVQYSPRRQRRLFDLDQMKKGGNIGFI